VRNFKYTTEIPEEDGDGVEEVTLVFDKHPDKMPLGIVRRHRGDQLALTIALVEWGISEGQLDLLDRVPISEMDPIVLAWGKHFRRDQDKPVIKRAKSYDEDDED
jgi:hypothetical protein